MTIFRHPSDEVMLDYAAGSLGEAAGLAMATHLTLCPLCRGASRRLEAVGGAFLAESVKAQEGPETFEAILATVAAAPPDTQRPPQPAQAVLPGPLREALGCDLDGVRWLRLGRGAYHYVIPTRESGATARLLRIPGGRPVPVHTHSGLEITLTLCGSYSDATGYFGRGDWQEADESLVHQPHAAPGQDCICLAVTEAPLRFKSWAARLVQPLLGI